MTDQPVSKALQAQLHAAQLANLNARRAALETRIATKKEAGLDTAEDESELRALLAETAALEQPPSQD